jgi:hypothetical protein
MYVCMEPTPWKDARSMDFRDNALTFYDYWVARCVGVYVSVYVGMYVCVCMYVCTYACVCMYVCMSVCINVCKYVRM